MILREGVSHAAGTARAVHARNQCKSCPEPEGSVGAVLLMDPQDAFSECTQLLLLLTTHLVFDKTAKDLFMPLRVHHGCAAFNCARFHLC